MAEKYPNCVESWGRCNCVEYVRYISRKPEGLQAQNNVRLEFVTRASAITHTCSHLQHRFCREVNG